VDLRLDNRRRGSRGSRLVSVLGEGFARQHDIVFPGTRRSRRRTETRAFRAAMVARFETATLTLLAARLVRATRIVRALLPLWRGILRWRKIATALRASTATAPPAPAPASSAAAIATAVAAGILSAAIVAVIAAWAGVLLGGIVLTKILRSGSVRLWLALFGFAMRRAMSLCSAFALTFHCPGRIVLMLVLEIRMHWLFMRDGLLCGVIRTERNRFIGAVSAGKRLAWESLNQGSRRGNGRRWRVTLTVVVIVVFKILEDVADVKESVAVQSDIHERRLHARENASNPSLVNAADQREFFFALDVDFD
jgi:hypothetical protein